MEADKMALVGGNLVNKVALVEELGQSIVGTQSSIVQMDQQRAKLREALHAIKRSSTDNKPSKIYTAVCSDLFVQYPSDFLQKVIKADGEKLDSLISEHRTELKETIDKLRRLEGDKDLTELGFNLETYQDRLNQ